MAKQNYDSDFCGSLPINFINQIQPYGFLVICDPAFDIVQLSDNIHFYTGISASDLIGTNLTDLLTPGSRRLLNDKIHSAQPNRSTATLGLNTKDNHSGQFLTVIHKKDDLFLFEFEPAATGSKGFLDIYQQIRETSSTIQQSADLDSALEIAVAELKEFSGFDKIMIYKFDGDWNGHVLAEAMEPGMESYKGITFPASDIPKQARELYLKTPYRQIPDIDYLPSKLYPIINPAKTGFTDLSDCNMRGVAKVHLEYLSNMNVKASMSTRILKGNQLWGLIACHHRTAKFLNYDACSVFELLSGIISSKISSAELQHNLLKNEAMQGLQAKIVEDIYSESLLIHGIERCGEAIMKLLNCTGLVYISESHKKYFGSCPDSVQISELIIWLQTKHVKSLFFTTHLSEEYEDAGRYSDIGSGLIAFPIVPNKGEFVLCFRAELEHSIDWGGNPNEAIRFTDDKQNYHPRNSFALWRQEIKHTSASFSAYEINTSTDLQRIFMELRLKDLNN